MRTAKADAPAAAAAAPAAPCAAVAVSGAASTSAEMAAGVADACPKINRRAHGARADASATVAVAHMAAEVTTAVAVDGAATNWVASRESSKSNTGDTGPAGYGHRRYGGS